jgi:hypothetical protein
MKNNTTLIMAAVITTVAFTVSALAWSQQPQQTQALAESESSTTSCIDNQPCNTTVTNSSTPDSQKSSTPDSQKSNHNKVRSSIICMNNQPCNTSAPNSTPSHTSASNPTTADSPKSNHNKVRSSIICINNNQPCNTSAPNSTASMPQNYPPIEDETSSALDGLTG